MMIMITIVIIIIIIIIIIITMMRIINKLYLSLRFTKQSSRAHLKKETAVESGIKPSAHL